MARPQALQSLWVGMAYDRTGGINDAKSEANQRKKGVVLFSSMDRCASAKALIEAGPDLESLPSKGHVSTIAKATETGHFKPARSLEINDPSFQAARNRTANRCAQVLRFRFNSERSDPSSDRHDSRIRKFRYKTSEPFRLMRRIVIQKSYDIRTASTNAAVSRSA